MAIGHPLVWRLIHLSPLSTIHAFPAVDLVCFCWKWLNVSGYCTDWGVQSGGGGVGGEMYQY